MSDFLNNLRNLALTDDKVEEIKKEITIIKEKLFNAYVDSMVNGIKKYRSKSAERRIYVIRNKKIIRSSAKCNTKFSIDIDDTIIQKIKSANLEKLLSGNV